MTITTRNFQKANLIIRVTGDVDDVTGERS
jgi:hypothetical protein